MNLHIWQNVLKNFLQVTTCYELLRRYELEVLGVVPYDVHLLKNSIERESKPIQDAIKQFYYRLNLPQARD